MLRLFVTNRALLLERDGAYVSLAPDFSLDGLFTAVDPVAYATAAFSAGRPESAPVSVESHAPLIQSQEVWAAGVTYLRSKSARVAESRDAGGGTFYDRVYAAERPELFFKATAHRVAASGTPVRIRSDSKWNVPEPELTLAVSAAGRIFGYTIGNDMSSRDIEGENPLYLPQAKVYDRCAALGPCLVITYELPGSATAIALQIRRAGRVVFAGDTTLASLRRPLATLAEWLFRDNSFPRGSYLMTGTGIIPPDDFTLQPGDEVRITIEPVGTLVNSIQ
ncbi:MAG TPA: fumarylacetoacetate hydrolase family protein [Lacunisphaera sp.]|jgi:2-dehydro-3-deoxy-D-arabinonate dehydratase|nr:fumarylacetoacetate hydrolase family protein [Lacunisphaera sp.]